MGSGRGNAALSLRERMELRLAQSLMRLPGPLLRAISGKPAVVRDGLTLHPELQLLLSLRERKRSPSLSSQPPHLTRAHLQREALLYRGTLLEVGPVRDLVLDGGPVPLPARLYLPRVQGPQPLLVFFHGGGFVLGDLETHDDACRLLCRHGRFGVLSVDYRLAPEAPFPAAVEDAQAALRWAHAHAAELGADPRRVAVGGDSAGGNLAAVVSQLARAEASALPAAQLLLYPAVDRSVTRPSVEHFSEGFFLSKADLEWFRGHYLGAFGDAQDLRANPLVGAKQPGLPPSLVITAGFDPLRDEGEELARALQEGGNPAELKRYEGFIHGFVNMSGLSPACRRATVEIANSFRRLLDDAAGAR